MVRWMTRVLAAIAAWGVSVLCVIAGFAFRMALLTLWPVAPYHCYAWDPFLDKALLGYVLFVPLLAAFVSEKGANSVDRCHRRRRFYFSNLRLEFHKDDSLLASLKAVTQLYFD